MSFSPSEGVIGIDKNYGEYALFMNALADITRVKIFNMLCNGEMCACKILEEFNITQPTLSYHMKIMSESGLIDGRRDGVWMRYSINKDKLQMIIDMFTGISDALEQQQK